MFKTSLLKKTLGIYCCAYACKAKPVKKKGGLCHKHYARKLRIKDPVMVRYYQWRSKSKSRGIDHGISLSEFRKWCNDTGYLSKGYRGYSATIDRIDPRRGYFLDNIQILSNRANASKGNTIDEIIKNINPQDEIPF